MSYRFTLSTTPRRLAGLMLLALLYSQPSQAQENDASGPVSTVHVAGAKSKGQEPFVEIPYSSYFRDYKFLRTQLPREAPLIDVWERVHYSSMSPAEQDVFTPPDGSIAVVSQSAKVNVPVRRGGYFVLPEVGQAYLEEGSIQVRQAIERWPHKMYVAYVLRLDEGQRISYANLGKALQQVAAVKNKISPFNADLAWIKRERHDAIKACFLDTEGLILIAGKPATGDTQGTCKIVAIDPARIESGDTVEFAGSLDVVTFVDGRLFKR